MLCKYKENSSFFLNLYRSIAACPPLGSSSSIIFLTYNSDTLNFFLEANSVFPLPESIMEFHPDMLKLHEFSYVVDEKRVRKHFSKCMPQKLKSPAFSVGLSFPML